MSRELFGRLVARKERERAVNSFNESYFTLLEYADFLDLQEICLAHPRAATFLKAFGGNPRIWQARFLELQALHDKLAGLREVNEAEVSFLQHLVRRLNEIIPAGSGPTPDRTVWGDRSAAPANGSTRTEDVPASAVQADDAPKTSPRGTSPPLPAPVAPLPPAPVVSTVATPVPPPTNPPVVVPGSPPESSEPKRPAPADVGSEDLDRALVAGDDKVVIAALYREVLGLSEHLMDNRGPMPSPVWDKVTESAWYARRFAILGLRPVSDFYNLYQAVREQVREGATSQELQFFLQAHAFQQVILAVGVFFHQNKVA